MKRILAAAFVAGILGGIMITPVQYLTTLPLLHEAERLEQARAAADQTASRDIQPGAMQAILIHAPHTPQMGGVAILPVHGNHDLRSHDHGNLLISGDHDHAAHGLMPTGGVGRLLLTVAFNILVGAGFALFLAAAYALHGKPMSGRRGVLWGLAGFAVFSLAPGMGLAPELPGMSAGGLLARQLWWLMAAAGAAGGLWLLVFGSRRWMLPLGVAVIALPHLIGAPGAGGFAIAGPGEPGAHFAAHFAVNALGTALLFWVFLGWLSGHFYRRFA